jgi:hypothetical protein
MTTTKINKNKNYENRIILCSNFLPISFLHASYKATTKLSFGTVKGIWPSFNCVMIAMIPFELDRFVLLCNNDDVFCLVLLAT